MSLHCRQGTPYDEYCSETDAKGVPVGSRIHGDCDILMKAVMQEILGKEDLKTWEDGRKSRMTVYDERRQD